MRYSVRGGRLLNTRQVSCGRELVCRFMHYIDYYELIYKIELLYS